MTTPLCNNFILASASPRRKKLLEKAGYEFNVVPSAIDESMFPTDMTALEYAKMLATAKAKDVAEKFPNKLILAADTIADLNGEIIGKADDAEHAEWIIKKLFSATHKIITAVALIKIDIGLEITETEITTVYPRKMNKEQIDSYIAADRWKNKAGAYGIQESGDKFIEKIEGSFTNVSGLPMERVKKMLEKLAD